jgi:hypothetical protein
MNRFMGLFHTALAATVGVFLIGRQVSAQQGFFDFSLQQGLVRFSFQTNQTQYYVLQDSLELPAFSPVMIAFGSNGPLYETAATNAAQFFFAKSISIYSPQDTLRDGIDDVFKLNNGLNPLDTNLAGSLSGFYGANGQPLTWVQYYNQTFARDIPTNEVYGREYSVFNFGLPTATYEAFSREVSIYTGQSPPLVAVPQEAYSREVSVFNFELPSAPVEAISRELSIYNGQSPPLVVVPPEVYSREVSVFNFGEAPSSIEADSREVSVFNFGAAFGSADANSREVSLFNNVLN